MGSNLAGKIVAVTFDGTPATLLYISATQINLQVPEALDASKTLASLVVTADGVSSNAVTVALALAPAHRSSTAVCSTRTMARTLPSPEPTPWASCRSSRPGSP